MSDLTKQPLFTHQSLGKLGAAFYASLHLGKTRPAPHTIHPARTTPSALLSNNTFIAQRVDIAQPVLAIKEPLRQLFKNAYNGNRAHIAVYIGNESDITRGDVNGYMGMANRIAEKLGGYFNVLRIDELAEKYGNGGISDEKDLLIAYCKDKGVPDLFFTPKYPGGKTLSYMGDNGSTVVLCEINEDVRRKLGAFMPNSLPREIVPHNLSPAMLAYEGQRFAQEYAELPRPFIGINLVGMGTESSENLAKKLASLKEAYSEATFFICSCHRTSSPAYDDLSRPLKELLSGEEPGRYPVIDFDFQMQRDSHGLDATWNPYKGLLDQADHIIVAGGSHSMTSEALLRGKTVYQWDGMTTSTALDSRGWVRKLAQHPDGQPLVSENIEKVDVTNDCADALISRLHAKNDFDENGQRIHPERPRPKGYLFLDFS